MRSDHPPTPRGARVPRASSSETEHQVEATRPRTQVTSTGKTMPSSCASNFTGSLHPRAARRAVPPRAHGLNPVAPLGSSVWPPRAAHRAFPPSTAAMMATERREPSVLLSPLTGGRGAP
jgi:hypothetical protein